MIKFRCSFITVLSLGALLAFSCNKPNARKKTGSPGAATDTPAPSTGSSADAETYPETTLTDQSRNIEDILEKGSLKKEDCDRYFKGEKDRETTLRCGKWMFFYGHLEVPGSPAKLLDLIRENAPNTVGKSLDKFGFYPDPYSKNALPIGVSEGPDMTAGVNTYTFTCASCHFGRIPDGRYVVGSPNPDFEFGKLTLTIAAMPELAASPNKKLPEEVSAYLNPIKDEMFGKGLTRASVLAEAIKLLPSVIVTKVAPPNDEAKLALVKQPAGVMDPYAPPSLNDEVAIPVRMSPLWGIRPEAMTAAGSTHGAMLGSNGGAPDLQHIMRTSATISGKIRAKPLGGDNFDPEAVMPLVQYVLTLRPPKSEKTFEAAKLATGEALFKKNCFACHNGPGFAGTRVFDVKEIGTDPNISRLADPENTGKAIFDVLTPPEVTKGIRARRLSAVWSLSHLFHNGSSSSLAEVFCLNGPRPENTRGDGYSTAGHTFTCEGMTTDEKNSLIYFLESL